MEFEQPNDSEQPVGFTTGVSPWLKIFFGAVVLCAIFFALGYTFGRNSAPIPTTTLTSDPKPVASASADKPSAAQSQNAAVTESQNVPAQPSDLTFSKSLENKPDAQLTPPAPQNPVPAQPVQSTPATAPATTKPAPELANIKVGGTIAVQVAAVTKEEDADALVNALRGKNYPVFVVSNVPGDKLFHVQVGPFAEIKDAEAIRARLASDGYNPIIKK
ncbi:MAG TPA: SPOR domain-containing protein [Terriglobales bacterium]|jgi:DedD protein|nr:SPOR domain-containing protein [Terriglobales bacterium]